MTTRSRDPSVFESFNARTLAPEQVARTFIPPTQFEEITKRSHTLIVGPRGSGKTTLLKMLQVPALEAWDHPDGDYYRHNIDYTGVFIPADAGWGAQLDAMGGGHLDESVHEKLRIAAFTTHILLSLVEAMVARVQLKPSARVTVQCQALTHRAEAELVNNLATGWMIQLDIPSLQGLKLKLRQRLLQIGKIASQLRGLEGEEASREIRDLEFAHLEFVQLVSYGIDAFNSAVGDQHGRWALLFDELEIAPAYIRRALIQSLRSVDQRILFKLSISPYSEDARPFEDSLSAMPGQDYLPVTLWYSTKDAAYEFCRGLFKVMLAEYGLPEVNPVDVFGRSEFDTDRNEWSEVGTAYGPGSRLRNRFVSLAKKDGTFLKYLKKHDIDPDVMHKVAAEKRERYIRKVTSIVAVREVYRAPDGAEGQKNKPAARSRKRPKLYAGATALFAITEGNPRWFIAIVSNLLGEYKKTLEKVSPTRQVQEIEKAAHRFRALLKTIPCTPTNTDKQPRGLLSVLDKIGTYFSEQVILADFMPEPVGTFIVDSRTDPNLLDALGKALNAGAIVYIPDDASEEVITSMRGKRFRISYLLAPYYRIPPTVGRAKSLYNILNDKEREVDLFTGFDDADD